METPKGEPTIADIVNALNKIVAKGEDQIAKLATLNATLERQLARKSRPRRSNKPKQVSSKEKAYEEVVICPPEVIRNCDFETVDCCALKPCETAQIESSSLGSDLQDSEQPLNSHQQPLDDYNPMKVFEEDLGSTVPSLPITDCEETMGEQSLLAESNLSCDQHEYELLDPVSNDYLEEIPVDMHPLVICEAKQIESYATIEISAQQDYAFDLVYIEYSEEHEVDPIEGKSLVVKGIPATLSETVKDHQPSRKDEPLDLFLINQTKNLSSGVSLFQVLDTHLGDDPDHHSMKAIHSSFIQQPQDSRTNLFEEGENDACLARVKLKELDILRRLILKPGTTVILTHDFGWDPGITGSRCLL